MMRNFMILLALVFSLSACETVEIPDRPSTFTYQASKQRTKEAIVRTFVTAGHQLISDTDFQLIFDRPATGFAAIWFGSNYDSQPNARVTLTLTGNNPTQVNTRLEIVTNPGSAFERRTDVSNNKEARNVIYQRMEAVRFNLTTPS